MQKEIALLTEEIAQRDLSSAVDSMKRLLSMNTILLMGNDFFALRTLFFNLIYSDPIYITQFLLFYFFIKPALDLWSLRSKRHHQ